MKEITHLTNLPTPCYYYNIELLQKTLEKVKAEVAKYPLFHVHYAVKANANPVLLKLISAAGLGVDCVSGNEVGRAIECGLLRTKSFMPEWVKTMRKYGLL